MNSTRKEKNKSERSVLTKETLGVVLVLFTTLCLVCLITREQVFSAPGQYVNAFLFGVFGYFAYAVAAWGEIAGIFLITDKKTGFSARRKAYITLAFIALATFLHLLAMGDNGGAGYSFADYVTASYQKGSGGIATASAGGFLTAIIAYPFLTLMQLTGGCVVVGAVFAIFVYFAIADVVKSAKSKPEAREKKLRSSYAPANEPPLNPVISGVKEYPASDVKFDKVRSEQRLFVSNPDDFKLKTKREIARSDKASGIKIDFEKNGLGVGKSDASYSDAYREDLKKKIEYVKTPPSYDLKNDKIIGKYTSDTKVSAPITSSSPSASAQTEGKSFSAIPFREHNGNDAAANAAALHSAYFAGKYAGSANEEKKVSAENGGYFTNKRYGATNGLNKQGGVISSGTATPVGSSTSATGATNGEPSKSAEKQANYKPTLAERLKAAEEAKKAAEASGISYDGASEKRTFTTGSESFVGRGDVANKEKTEDKAEEIASRENAESFGGRTRERGISARDIFGDGAEEDAGEPKVIREPRAGKILFGEDKSAEEKSGFISRAIADDNGGVRTGEEASDRGRNGARLAFGGAFAAREEEKENKPEKVQPPINREYVRPPLDLLEARSAPVNAPQEDHEERMEVIQRTLEEFHVNAVPQSYVQGPTITRYEIMMPAGVPVRKVLSYDDDLRMRLASKSGVRIEAPIPGKNLVGIEVANKTPVPVGIREVLEGAAGKPEKAGALTFAIGKNLVGDAITDNLAKGPHYLVAGATGSGKSVCLNVMIVSLIMRYSPEELRLILIDPKRVGFRCYEHLPHLMIDEIVTEPQKAIAVLQWAYNEMERRYDVFAACTESVISDIDGYNKEVASDTVPKMPRIVIIVDELADLMETSKKDMEARIRALAQKARAAGVHLVLATQRPSVDIITGTIKANLPSRIALKVMNSADSQTILSQGGAEKLLGNGDMLYKNSAMPECERYQGAWISDREINSVVKYIIENNAAYFDEELQEFLDKSSRPRDAEVSAADGGGDEDDDGVNEFFLKALWLAVNSGTVSISQLQRRFQIGYARAGGLVDKMERMGFVSGNEGSKARRVLISREEFIEKFGEMPDVY